MIHGAGRCGRAALSVSGEVPHVHFGLGVDGDPHDVGGIVGRLVFRAHSARGVDSVSLGHTVQENAGRVRKGSGPRVMAVLRNLIVDLCSFSGKTSLAAANRHKHVPPREVGGTRANLNWENETALLPLPVRLPLSLTFD